MIAEDDQRVGWSLRSSRNATAWRVERVGLAARARSLQRQRHVLGRGSPVVAARLEHAPAACSNRGSERNAAQPVSPSSPSPMIAWRSRLEPSGGHRVVDVQRAAADRTADDPVELVDRLVERPRSGRRSPTRTGGRSPGTRRAASAAGRLQQRRELLERAPERAAGARRCPRACSAHLSVSRRGPRRSPCRRA